VSWEALRTLDTSTLGAGTAYFPVSTPLLYASYIFKMVNNSNTLVTVSIDGLTDIDVLPADSFFLYDENKTQAHEMLPAGTRVFVKGSAGVGTIYLVSQYLVVG
jgi:hypothetical protein